jgi:magnesium transporter
VVNQLTAFLAATIVSYFSATIEKIVALAVLMPIVAGMGGNAGTQTMTITVRALATRSLDIHNGARIIRREAGVGLINGVIFGILIGVIARLWFHDWDIAGIIMSAMLINMIAAALAGIIIPLILDRVGADPAVSSAVFVTTVTDMTGFLSLLGIATWWYF